MNLLEFAQEINRNHALKTAAVAQGIHPVLYDKIMEVLGGHKHEKTSGLGSAIGAGLSNAGRKTLSGLGHAFKNPRKLKDYAIAGGITSAGVGAWQFKNETQGAMAALRGAAEDVRELMPEMKEVAKEGIDKVTEGFHNSSNTLSDTFRDIGGHVINAIQSFGNPFQSQEAFKEFLATPQGKLFAASGLTSGGLGLWLLVQRRRAARLEEQRHAREQRLTDAKVQYYAGKRPGK